MTYIGDAKASWHESVKPINMPAEWLLSIWQLFESGILASESCGRYSLMGETELVHLVVGPEALILGALLNLFSVS